MVSLHNSGFLFLTVPCSEDTLEDVRARIHAIQEEEIDQFRALTGFLDMEIRYAENYLEVMKGIKADWVDE